MLLQLFKSDRRLWVQTGLKGRSVLHVAVMQRCSELVHELHHYKGDLVLCGKNWQTPFEFLWENARDWRLKHASAQDIWLVMEGLPVKIGNESSADLYLEVGESLAGRYRDDYIKSHVMCTMFFDNEMLRLREAISDIASKKEFVMDENDVDFNFENAERKELYVHMACNMLRNDPGEIWESCGDGQIGQFIIAVVNDLCEKNLLQKLFDKKDAQGRTILQILVSSPGYSSISSFLSEILQILPDACV